MVSKKLIDSPNGNVSVTLSSLASSSPHAAVTIANASTTARRAPHRFDLVLSVEYLIFTLHPAFLFLASGLYQSAALGAFS
jgi:hypothetical protein